MSGQNCLGGGGDLGRGQTGGCSVEGSGQHLPGAAAVGRRGGGNALFFELREFFCLSSNRCPGFAGGKMRDPQEKMGGGEPVAMGG